MTAHVDIDTCFGCKACSKVCPSGAITYTPQSTIDETVCIGCGACANACPVSAIEVE